jgi:hypothetical protein
MERLLEDLSILRHICTLKQREAVALCGTTDNSTPIQPKFNYVIVHLMYNYMSLVHYGTYLPSQINPINSTLYDTKTVPNPVSWPL